MPVNREKSTKLKKIEYIKRGAKRRDEETKEVNSEEIERDVKETEH